MLTRVFPAGQTVGVLHIADAGEVRADLQFAEKWVTSGGVG